MQITRRHRQGVVVSLVAMVDVLMIMLVFFMVTSTYLDLDMIPVAEAAPDGPAQGGVAAVADAATADGPLLIRIGADGRSVFRGVPLEPAALTEMLADARAQDPALEVLVLPSGAADVQALVSAMDAVTRAGVTRVRIIRLEPRP
jgi:biopolymer transport protein ExbD